MRVRGFFGMLFWGLASSAVCPYATAADREVAMASGFGGLTIGVDQRGTVTSCRWPRPGYNSHLRSGEGLVWGISIDDEVVWLDDRRWRVTRGYAGPASLVMTTRYELDTGLVVELRAFVLPRRDVFVSEVRVSGAPAKPRLFWFADFSPSTRHVPELGAREASWNVYDDFAAFADVEADRVYHFRPGAPGREAWKRAEGLVSARAASDEWRLFESGTWLGYSADVAIAAEAVGAGSVTRSEVASRMGESGGAATGDCWSAVELVPRENGGVYEARVNVAFGDTMESVDEALEAIVSEHTATLVSMADKASQGATRLGQLPNARHAEFLDATRRAMLTILTHTDASTGSVVQNLRSFSPDYQDRVVDGAWMVYGVDLLGGRRIARRHLKFYLEQVRGSNVRGLPMGSLPAVMYGDGSPASPHVVIDDESVAWLLWAAWSHATFLEGREREGYLRSIWDKVSLAGDFVAGWADSRRGAPLGAEDPITMRDLRTHERLYSAKVGLDSALKIAELAGETAPSTWTRRQRRVELLVESLLVDEKRWSQGNEPLPMFLSDFVDPASPAVARAVERRLRGLPNLSAAEAVETAFEVALAHADHPERLRYMQPSILKGLMRSREVPDAYIAALTVVAGHVLFPVDAANGGQR